MNPRLRVALLLLFTGAGAQSCATTPALSQTRPSALLTALTLRSIEPYPLQLHEPTQLPGLVRELRFLDVGPVSRPLSFEALITRPDREGRMPLVILSHGSPMDNAHRQMGPTGFSAQSIAFAEAGYAVVVVMRRGYGRSEGKLAEHSGDCSDRNYVRAGTTSADDLRRTIEALKSEPWVDASKILVVGVSAGGFASVALGAGADVAVTGIISFAGGRGVDKPGHVCQPERLVGAMGTFGQKSKVPNLWIYSDNDLFFPPDLAKQMLAAYGANGAPVEFVAVPPWGKDGHSYIEAPANRWWPQLAPFLSRLGLPSGEPPTPEKVELPPPESLDQKGKLAFANYLQGRGFEKAFATDGISWGWATGRRTPREAAHAALLECSGYGHRCFVYALGNTLAPEAEAIARVRAAERPPLVQQKVLGVLGGSADDTSP
jgi:dienelactone hydrolase